MPRIFDNIDLSLLPALQDTLRLSDKADFCVGYFNLREWKGLDGLIDRWPGTEESRCRLLVGMQRLPQDELKEMMSLVHRDDAMDNQTAIRLKRKLAEEFRQQLTYGVPTDADEAGLRRLAVQLKAGKVVVKLFLKHPLHAKLYLCFRPDPINPIVGYVGSSNLTLAGLSAQGELNVDVLDHDAGLKLARWFEDRWADKWCLDISKELVQIIEESWAREDPIPPYHIYLKIAYHLSQEARAGLSEFRIPRDFGKRLFPFQEAAVKIAAHHLHKRGGVLIGDVVGLGKTLMAAALARIFQDDHNTETLIICPKNLVPMWEDYKHNYRMLAKVVPLSRVIRELPELRRYRLVLIDESHNLRNREGRRFKAIQEYIVQNDSKCILLTATPYNKTYLDLSAQLRLFVPEDKDLGVRPEKLIQRLGGEAPFMKAHQCPVRSLRAFEKSEETDDWRDLMRLYLVRRTRSFIQQHYATTDPENGRRFLTFEDGSRSYFPARIPRTVSFQINDKSKDDPYARLYAQSVVDTVGNLSLPRYGLGNYVAPTPDTPPTNLEAHILDGLSRAGQRLIGFCRTNLFKRLESGGPAFIQSIERHILRNFVFLHAIESNGALPLGSQAAEYLDARTYDEDADSAIPGLFDDDGDDNGSQPVATSLGLETEADYRARAAEVYASYTTTFKRRFKWLRATLFVPKLKDRLLADALALLQVLKRCGQWDATKDAKLTQLYNLVATKHAGEKILVFTQFADTARYVKARLAHLGVGAIEVVTGDSPNPTDLAWRFSPVSNDKQAQIAPEKELRILVATDVLSEGQNLQDGHIIVNYDLPWAVIRLIQRAGRVDRIGQQADKILCYSFLPADGVERIIRLRGRVRQRLRENAEVVGTDEAFFEDDIDDGFVLDIYNENAGIMDGDADTEVDLASYAYQIWKNAIDRDPALNKSIPALPDVVYSTKQHAATPSRPHGVLIYVKTGEGNDALAWINEQGESVTQSQLTILQAAACEPDAPPAPRHARHHELVQKGVAHLIEEEKSIGGQLGRPSGARFRTYERLKDFLRTIGTTRDLLYTDEYVRSIERALDDIYRFPLRQSAIDTLNRRLKTHIRDEELAELVTGLREDERLCIVHEDGEHEEPRIICSMGLTGG